MNVERRKSAVHEEEEDDFENILNPLLQAGFPKPERDFMNQTFASNLLKFHF